MNRSSNTNRLRKGIAAFEMAVVLPSLLILIWLLMWFGFAFIYKAELTVECRSVAWQKRYAATGNRAWKSEPLLLFRANGNQYVSHSNTKQVSDLEFFEGWPEMKSSHVVLAGSWDHTELDLEHPVSGQLLPPDFRSPIILGLFYSQIARVVVVANEVMGKYYDGKNALDGVQVLKAELTQLRDFLKSIKAPSVSAAGLSSELSSVANSFSGSMSANPIQDVKQAMQSAKSDVKSLLDFNIEDEVKQKMNELIQPDKLKEMVVEQLKDQLLKSIPMADEIQSVMRYLK